jgi:DNA-binding response OmpR family regulator
MSKILLVEDDKFLSKAYQDGLEDAGFTVVRASDGKEAMKELKSFKPDIILLDLIMPLENGISTLEEIKGDEALKNIPVMILSNSARDSDIKKAMALGVVDYLIKADFSMEEVIKKVKVYLGSEP